MIQWLVAAPTVPLFLLAAIIGFRKPLFLLAIYATVVPFGSAVSLPVGLPPAFSSASTLLGLAAAIGIGAHVAVARDRARWLQPAVPVWLMFFAVAVATTTWSINRAASTSEILILASLVALYVVVGLMQPTAADLTLFERALVVGGALTGLYALALLVAGDLPTFSGIPRFEVPGGGGENGDPNITAASLLLPLLVALSRGLRLPAGTERAASLATAALLTMATMLTVSRGAVLAMAVCITGVVVVTGGRRAVVWAMVPVLLGVAVFLVAPAELQDHLTKPTSSGRSEVWAIGLQACEAYCATGSGWGTFPDAHAEVILSTPQASGTRLRFVAHNIWLQAAVEAGVVGLLLLVAAFITTMLGLMTVPARMRAPALASVVGLMITNTFLSNIDFKYAWLVFIYAAMVTQAHGAPVGARAPQRLDVHRVADHVTVGAAPGAVSVTRPAAAAATASPTRAARAGHATARGQQ